MIYLIYHHVRTFDTLGNSNNAIFVLVKELHMMHKIRHISAIR
jgi:hypothetical protein